MRIHMQVSASPETSFPFEHGGPAVAIGRDPAGELPLEGDASEGVSWNHARIRLTPQAAYLSDAGSTNGTFLNDRRVEDQAAVQVGDYIRLGQGGPTLRVLRLDLAETRSSPPGSAPRHRPATVPDRPATHNPSRAAVAPPPASRGARRASVPIPVFSTTRRMIVELQRQHGKWLLTAGLAAVLLSAVVGLVLWRQSGRVAQVVDHTADLSKQAADLSRQGQDLSQRASELNGRVAQVAGQVAEISAADAANIHKQYGDAVYLAALRHPGGALQPFGTAFAVDASGRFGTNAHVALPVRDLLNKGAQPVLVSPGGVRLYRIVSAVAHDLYDPRNLSYDVGLLTVRLPEGQTLPKTVPLASDAELRELAEGDPLCTIGFPVYSPDAPDYAGSLSKISPRTYQGRLNRLVTFTRERGEFANRYWIEHDMHSWKGASGSPIFNRHGNVIAVHNSGSFVRGMAVANDPRGPAALDTVTMVAGAPNKGAIRIDLLRDLMGYR